MFGKIMISTSGQNYTIKNVMKASVIPFTNLVNQTRSASNWSVQPHQEHSITTKSFDDQKSRIERLAEMKEEGDYDR